MRKSLEEERDEARRQRDTFKRLADTRGAEIVVLSDKLAAAVRQRDAIVEAAKYLDPSDLPARIAEILRTGY